MAEQGIDLGTYIQIQVLVLSNQIGKKIGQYVEERNMKMLNFGASDKLNA